MTMLRVMLVVTVAVALQLNAAKPNPVTAWAKLTSDLHGVLKDQTKTTLSAFEAALLEGDALDVEDIEKAWKTAFHEKLRTQLEESDREVLGVVALSDGEASARLSKAAAEMRGALDERLTEAFEAKQLDIPSDLAEEGDERVKTLAKAQTKAQKKLAAEVLKPGLDERQERILLAFRNAGTDTVRAEVQSKLDAERAAMEKAFLDQFTKETGVSKVMHCLVTNLDTATPSFSCKPNGLHLGGMSIAHVRVSGLPANRKVIVRADLSETADHRTSVFARGKDGKNCPEPEPPPATNPQGCLDPFDGKCDWSEFPSVGDKAIGTRDVVVLVHTARVFGPTYSTEKGESLRCAMIKLRKPETGRALQLVSRGKGLELGLRVTIVGDPSEKVLSTSIPVAYERWKFETGTMFAINGLVDHRLVTVPDETAAGKVKIVEKREDDTISQETVLFLNLVPANYEMFAIGFGLHTSSDRNVSYYFGGSVRLLSLGERALASFSAGVIGAERRRFPGIDLSKSYLSNDPVLQGDLRYKNGWYVGLSLGFRFGPMGGENEAAP